MPRSGVSRPTRDQAWRDVSVPADPRALGPPEDPEAVARKILLDQLTGQARSRAELATKLAGRGVPADLATRMLDRFEDVGLVDDQAFAHEWVRSRQAGRGLARRALAHELRRKGVDDETAQEALGTIDSATEEEAARELVRRKLGSMARFPQEVKARRLVGMLARKGYGAGLAYSVVRSELNLHDPDLV